MKWLVELMIFLKNKDFSSFIHLINESWNLKKNTSSLILQNKKIKNLDNFLSQHKKVLLRANS